MKFCYTCNQNKDLTDFSKDRSKKDGLRTQCKKCRAAYQKQHNSKPEVIKQNKQYNKNIQRFRCHGITKHDFDVMLIEQNNCCAICTKTLTNPFIDHCHHTGKIRGVLCPKCNHGLGQFNDDPDLIKIALNYLLRSKS